MTRDLQRLSQTPALTPEGVRRLQRASSLFDIYLGEGAAGAVHFRVLDKAGWREFDVPESLSSLRLASEVCEKTLRWVHFHPAKSAAETFLALSDERIDRLGVLYQRWKRQGYPEE